MPDTLHVLSKALVVDRKSLPSFTLSQSVYITFLYINSFDLIIIPNFSYFHFTNDTQGRQKNNVWLSLNLILNMKCPRYYCVLDIIGL